MLICKTIMRFAKYDAVCKPIKLPPLLLYSDHVKALMFKGNFFVNIVFYGKLILPHEFVVAAHRFVQQQIMCDTKLLVTCSYVVTH